VYEKLEGWKEDVRTGKLGAEGRSGIRETMIGDSGDTVNTKEEEEEQGLQNKDTENGKQIDE
jgi:hypothetical protein